MYDYELYERLFNGGNYSLPYLISFSHPTAGTLRLVNNNENITYGGNTYTAASFDYNPPDLYGAGGTLNISPLQTDADINSYIEQLDDRYSLSVIGVISENKQVTPIKAYRHFNGSLTVNENGAIEFTLSGDDRLEMTFPPYTYDTDNNRANA